MEPVSGMDLQQRDVWLGLRRGLRGICPACGKSKLFSSYLKVVPKCANCGHVLEQYRADDGPAYFTILIIGHIMIAPLLFVKAIRNWPVETLSVVMVVTLVTAALILLPIVKGAFVGVQWAVRDRGGA
ncbi:MAG: DUF983 domain-containing protein [Micropepsaceae bacterium]